jgi:hypothetical protein
MKQSLLLFSLITTSGIAGLSAQTCVELRTPDGITRSVMPVIIYSGYNNTRTFDIYLDQNPDPTTLVGTSSSIMKFQLTTPLAPGNLYYYKIVGKDASGNEVCTSEIRTFNTIAPPENDNPENAIPLTIEANPISGTTIASTPSDTSDAPKAGDVFYSFIADQTDIRILPLTTHSNHPAPSLITFKVYRSNPDGSLGPLIYTTYDTLNGQNIMNNEQTPLTGGLIVGERYYIAVDEYIDNDYKGVRFRH